MNQMVKERHSALQTAIAIAVVAAFFTVLNWPEIASRLAFGVPVPDARLEVTLDSAVPARELLARLDNGITDAGVESTPRNAHLIASDEKMDRDSFLWFYDSDAKLDDYRIGVNFPYKEANPSSFEFIFRNAGTDNFTEKEWRMFFDWKERILPQMFPDAVSIEISRHPAEFTDIEDIESIANRLGVELPVRLSEKLKRESL